MFTRFFRNIFNKYLKEFRSCVTSFNKWFDEICNSFDYPWSNGLLEGTHTKIKNFKEKLFWYENF
ncbi:MAG: transposase [Peptoniphilus sp.]|uniref:transposase n=1 Tax=Peptoniphilus TaxID=162289 RepID=UPI0009D68C6A